MKHNRSILKLNLTMKYARYFLAFLEIWRIVKQQLVKFEKGILATVSNVVEKVSLKREWCFHVTFLVVKSPNPYMYIV